MHDVPAGEVNRVVVGSPARPPPWVGRETAPQQQRNLILNLLEAGIVEFQSIHDLVVVVARRRCGIAGEGRRVGTFEVNHAPTVLIEEGMVNGIVEAVLVVGHDLLRAAPRPGQCGSLRVPDLSEQVKSPLALRQS